MTYEDFSPCDYLPNLQQVLFETDELNEEVDYETFVLIPEDLHSLLNEQFGNETEFSGAFVSVVLCKYLYEESTQYA